MKLTLDTDKKTCYIFYTATFPKWNERNKWTMSASFLIQTTCEILVAAFIIWGLFNEQKLIDFEDKLIAKWKARKSKWKIHANQIVQNVVLLAMEIARSMLILELGSILSMPNEKRNKMLFILYALYILPVLHKKAACFHRLQEGRNDYVYWIFFHRNRWRRADGICIWGRVSRIHKFIA